MELDPIYKASIQKALNERAGQRLDTDGIFGGKTTTALMIYQKQMGIPQSGLYDVATQNLLDPFIRQKFLTFNNIIKASTDLQVTTAHVRAVSAVESNGAGFLPDGRVKLLFERHHFLKALLAKYGPEKVAQIRAANPPALIDSSAGGYATGPTAADRAIGEQLRFNAAFKIDKECAIYATSFGLFQVMGFNHELVGFSNLSDFYVAMCTSETKHMDAFVQFNKKNAGGKMWRALQMNDWATYAKYYNGSNYAINKYDVNLKDKFDRYSKNIYAA